MSFLQSEETLQSGVAGVAGSRSGERRGAQVTRVAPRSGAEEAERRCAAGRQYTAATPRPTDEALGAEHRSAVARRPQAVADRGRVSETATPATPRRTISERPRPHAASPPAKRRAPQATPATERRRCQASPHSRSMCRGRRTVSANEETPDPFQRASAAGAKAQSGSASRQAATRNETKRAGSQDGFQPTPRDAPRGPSRESNRTDRVRVESNRRQSAYQPTVTVAIVGFSVCSDELKPPTSSYAKP